MKLKTKRKITPRKILTINSFYDKKFYTCKLTKKLRGRKKNKTTFNTLKDKVIFSIIWEKSFGGAYTGQCSKCGESLTCNRWGCIKGENMKWIPRCMSCLEGFYSIKNTNDLRKKVWEYRIGKKYYGKCFCCNTSLSCLSSSWHVSHEVPRKYGGLYELKNLYVCCSDCNLKMGTSFTCTEFKKLIRNLNK
jgi:5-methylcytosine-specific restriction endonuclease McrA